MSSTEAAINHVWPRKCNNHAGLTVHTHTQPCALNHRCIHTHLHLQICACPPSLWVSWSWPSAHMKQGVMGKELLSGSAAAKHIVASVIQASESPQITTTPSPELQLACNEAWKKKERCKTNNSRGAQRCTHWDLFELEQSPQCCCSVLDAQVYLQFHACHLSTED